MNIKDFSNKLNKIIIILYYILIILHQTNTNTIKCIKIIIFPKGKAITTVITYDFYILIFKQLSISHLSGYPRARLLGSKLKGLIMVLLDKYNSVV